MPISENAKKIAINTISLNIRFIINVIIAIFTTRIALQSLGSIDFGLFSLITGIILMLSFLNSALLQSTQRFLSIYIGLGDSEKIKSVFNTSLSLHVIFSIVFYVAIVLAQPFLFDGFLNIPHDRVTSTISAYHYVALTTVITLISISFDALINAQEDMWFLSISDIVVAVLRLVAAIAISVMFNENNGNLLVSYTFFILLSTIIGLIIKWVWVAIKYPGVKIQKKYLYNKIQMKEQFGFTGWNALGTFAAACRGQGVAIVMNVFFGPAINAAYGVANQLNSVATSFSSSLLTAFMPQVVKNYGRGDNEKMLTHAIFFTKIALFISVIIGLPILLENELILRLWLKDVPQYASIFCNLMIFIFFVMQTYSGVTGCIYAEGNIKNYQILTSIILIIPIILGYFGYKYFSLPPQSIIYIMLAGQIGVMIVTLYFAKIRVGLNALQYFHQSVFKPFVIILAGYIIGYLMISFINQGLVRLFLVAFFEMIFVGTLFFKLVFDKTERELIKTLYIQIITKIKR